MTVRSTVLRCSRSRTGRPGLLDDAPGHLLGLAPQPLTGRGERYREQLLVGAVTFAPQQAGDPEAFDQVGQGARIEREGGGD